MFLTIHAIFALIFIKFAPNIFWAFIIGFVSHFILDAIPHGDKEMETWSDEKKTQRMPAIAFFDILMLLIVWYLLNKNLNLPFDIGLFLILGAIVPDAIQAAYIAFSNKPFTNKYYKFHEYIHKLILKKLISMKIGFFIQLTSLIFFIYLLTLLYK